MNPQEFLSNRIDALKRMFVGQARPNEYVDQAKIMFPGGIPGKLAAHTGHSMMKSMGTPDAAQMSMLGLSGNAPIYDTPLNDDKRGSFEARVQ